MKILEPGKLCEKYEEIRQKTDEIKKELTKGKKTPVEKYLDTINNCDNIDKIYQRNYKSFYKLTPRSVSNEAWLKQYFGIITSEKENHKRVDIEDVCNIISVLSKIPSDKERRTKKNHYSFSTKLLHTINQDYPIYDSKVVKFYFDKNSSQMDRDRFKAIYNDIVKEYTRIEKHPKLKKIFDDIFKKIDNSEKISFVKKIDFVIWQYQKIIDKKAKQP